MITPYKIMSERAQFAADSVLLPRPTNCFSGFYSSLKHGQIYQALVALMTILAQFMPILLANVPYQLTQTHRTHIICARLSISIIIVMMLTLIGSMFIRWPDMPVDPRSVAGAMYYVSKSNMTEQFAGLARMDKRDRVRAVEELGGAYWYGDVVTSRGETRQAVEREEPTLEVEGDGDRGRGRLGSRMALQQEDTAYHGHGEGF